MSPYFLGSQIQPITACTIVQCTLIGEADVNSYVEDDDDLNEEKSTEYEEYDADEEYFPGDDVGDDTDEEEEILTPGW